MALFPYTPGFVHGEELGHAVGIVTFDDQSEQRFQVSGQRGLLLTYEFPGASSKTQLDLASWFVGHHGMQDSFTVVDHRDGTVHVAHHAAPGLVIDRGPVPMKRNVRMQFLTVDAGGITPVGVAFVRPPSIDCGIFPESSTPTGSETPGGTVTSAEPPPPPVGSGSTPVGSDEDPGPGTFLVGSNAWFEVWYKGAEISGDVTDFTNAALPNRLYAVPFIISRSGAHLDRLGVAVYSLSTNSGDIRWGLYIGRNGTSGTDFYPDRLLTEGPPLKLGLLDGGSEGFYVHSVSLVLSAGIYYAAFIENATGVGERYSGTNDPIPLLGADATNFGQVPAYEKVWSVTANLPNPYPTSAGLRINADVPAVALRFLR